MQSKRVQAGEGGIPHQAEAEQAGKPGGKTNSYLAVQGRGFT